MSTYPSTPETVCLQCGDVGFSNAFVYCIKCLEFAVHRYCLGVIPKSVDEFVRWICDDCIADDQNQHLLHSTSEHDADHAGTGMQNNDVVEEHVHESGPSRSHEACVQIDLVECSESDNDSDLSGSGVNAEAAVLLVPEDTKRCKQSSSQSHAVAIIDDNLIFNELSSDTSPRGSVEKKRKGPGIGTHRAAMTAEKSDINLRRESHVCKDRKLASRDHSTISADCMFVKIESWHQGIIQQSRLIAIRLLHRSWTQFGGEVSTYVITTKMIYWRESWLTCPSQHAIKYTTKHASSNQGCT